MNRAERRHRTRAVGARRRRRFAEVWPLSADYVLSLSVNEHAVNNLGTVCSCAMCQYHDPRRDRRAEKERWKRDVEEQ